MKVAASSFRVVQEKCSNIFFTKYGNQTAKGFVTGLLVNHYHPFMFSTLTLLDLPSVLQLFLTPVQAAL